MVNKMISRSSWKITTLISNALNNGLSKYIKKKLKLWRKNLSIVCPTSGAFFLYKLHMVLTTVILIIIDLTCIISTNVGRSYRRSTQRFIRWNIYSFQLYLYIFMFISQYRIEIEWHFRCFGCSRHFIRINPSYDCAII